MSTGRTPFTSTSGAEMANFFIPFNYKRREPLVVSAAVYGQPLVQVGGWVALTTEAYENARLTNLAAGVFGNGDNYATALMGGEPYADWIQT